MKKPIILAIMVATLSYLNASCGILSSDDSAKIKIELDSQLLTAQDTLTAQIINHSSEDILIYGETLHSNVQRLNDSGNWYRLFSWTVKDGEPIPWSDWYTHLHSKDVYETSISYQLVESLIEKTNNSVGAGSSRELFSVDGEYRLIFELVFNEDYENQQKIYSKSFTVK
jgi:hypothetical protein